MSRWTSGDPGEAGHAAAATSDGSLLVSCVGAETLLVVGEVATGRSNGGTGVSASHAGMTVGDPPLGGRQTGLGFWTIGAGAEQIVSEVIFAEIVAVAPLAATLDGVAVGLAHRELTTAAVVI